MWQNKNKERYKKRRERKKKNIMILGVKVLMCSLYVFNERAHTVDDGSGCMYLCRCACMQDHVCVGNHRVTVWNVFKKRKGRRRKRKIINTFLMDCPTLHGPSGTGFMRSMSLKDAARPRARPLFPPPLVAPIPGRPPSTRHAYPILLFFPFLFSSFSFSSSCQYSISVMH